MSEQDASVETGTPRHETRKQATTPFDDWWESDGKFYDPDTSDVSWFDKRKELAEYAFRHGWQDATSSPWIDATQQMPKIYAPVLVVINGYVQHTIAKWNGKMWEWMDEEADAAPKEEVRHWMPLPGPPEQESNV